MALEKSFATNFFGANPDLRRSYANEIGLEQLQSDYDLTQVVIEEAGSDGETENVTYYVAEGDLLLDEDEVFLYALQQETLQRQRELLTRLSESGLQELAVSSAMALPAAMSAAINLPTAMIPPALVGITNGQRIVRWKDGMVLTYCVLRRRFRNNAEYEEIRDNMLLATQAWENTCGVKFEHVADLDDSFSLRPQGVVFSVRGIDVGGQFIASAFFPNSSLFRRRVLIDPSYFSTAFDGVGVLRHELGHVLGFRHEHIRSGAPSVCRGEDTIGTIDLTQYDPQSVMHYFCGGVGSLELAITDIDRLGAQKIYGLPLSLYEFVE